MSNEDISVKDFIEDKTEGMSNNVTIYFIVLSVIACCIIGLLLELRDYIKPIKDFTPRMQAKSESWKEEFRLLGAEYPENITGNYRLLTLKYVDERFMNPHDRIRTIQIPLAYVQIGSTEHPIDHNLLRFRRDLNTKEITSYELLFDTLSDKVAWEKWIKDKQNESYQPLWPPGFKPKNIKAEKE